MEKRYQEFSSSVQDHSLFGMITMSPANKDYNEAPLTMEDVYKRQGRERASQQSLQPHRQGGGAVKGRR